jgi:endonuclease/exonuclease/phosphatase family metal-dependent hydrolase
MNVRVLILCILLIILIRILLRRQIVNYKDESSPVFIGSFAEAPPDFSRELTVVSYNTHFVENIDLAIEELQEIPQIDIILLQEVDEIETERIARALKNDYVYYPASVHTKHDKYFGNAILTNWPIKESEKLILPHENPKNGQIRIAVCAIVVVDKVEILTCTVHTETAWLGYKKRLEQVDFLINNIDEDAEYVIVGGDFNTVSSRSITDLDTRFGESGLERATNRVGVTTTRLPVGFAMDHIYTRGMSVLDAGKHSQAKASDHLPVWAQLEFGQDGIVE